MSLNPLFWLHLRIGGSARTNVIIAIAFTAVVIVFASISLYVAGMEAGPRGAAQAYARVNAVWLVIMTVAQGVFLLLLAPSAIRRAVQRDFDSGMIESHRLSPMSNLKIVLGYVTGAPIQALMLYALSLVFGSYFATRYALSTGLGGAIGLRVTLSAWCFAQGGMLVLALGHDRVRSGTGAVDRCVERRRADRPAHAREDQRRPHRHRQRRGVAVHLLRDLPGGGLR